MYFSKPPDQPNAWVCLCVCHADSPSMSFMYLWVYYLQVTQGRDVFICRVPLGCGCIVDVLCFGQTLMRYRIGGSSNAQLEYHTVKVWLRSRTSMVNGTGGRHRRFHNQSPYSLKATFTLDFGQRMGVTSNHVFIYNLSLCIHSYSIPFHSCVCVRKHCI